MPSSLIEYPPRPRIEVDMSKPVAEVMTKAPLVRAGGRHRRRR
jgi:hypothetical protein